MRILEFSTDIYYTVAPGQVVWYELARGEELVFVKRVEGIQEIDDATVCEETLIECQREMWDSFRDIDEKERAFYMLISCFRAEKDGI